ncbi:unnamed protein product, partial [Dracunculus medinensis]|uniref:DB domain-containing protein n=1 Tax=Dracunculus medinensis TaxID=318479 RepID=A0A0N4UN64_DRAME
VCGGPNPCLPPPSLPPAQCQPSCGPGYHCGQYGCARRARARASNTLRVKTPSEFRSPNQLFMDCCETRGLPDACLQKCTFNTFTKEELLKMYFKQDPCPIEASAEIQFCAAQGRDHRHCCGRNGVGTTLAGEKCLTFCDQRPGNITQLDFSYASCYERFDNMRNCFLHDIIARSETRFI